jgi:hypothetical protein
MTDKEYLDKAKGVYNELSLLDENYNNERKAIKRRLTEVIEDGRFEADLSVKDFADEFGVKRQTVNKVLVDVLGVRHPDKAKAGSLGHINRG